MGLAIVGDLTFRIIVMDKGKIVEDGNHESLLALDGFYARLNEHQVMPEAELA